MKRCGEKGLWASAVLDPAVRSISEENCELANLRTYEASSLYIASSTPLSSPGLNCIGMSKGHDRDLENIRT